MATAKPLNTHVMDRFRQSMPALQEQYEEIAGTSEVNPIVERLVDPRHFSGAHEWDGEHLSRVEFFFFDSARNSLLTHAHLQEIGALYLEPSATPLRKIILLRQVENLRRNTKEYVDLLEKITKEDLNRNQTVNQTLTWVLSHQLVGESSKQLLPLKLRILGLWSEAHDRNSSYSQWLKISLHHIQHVLRDYYRKAYASGQPSEEDEKILRKCLSQALFIPYESSNPEWIENALRNISDHMFKGAKAETPLRKDLGKEIQNLPLTTRVAAAAAMVSEDLKSLRRLKKNVSVQADFLGLFLETLSMLAPKEEEKFISISPEALYLTQVPEIFSLLEKIKLTGTISDPTYIAAIESWQRLLKVRNSPCSLLLE